jgi:hypothetical protein
MDIAALPAMTTSELAEEPAPPAERSAPAGSAKSRRSQYPSATVYLPPKAIRILKEIGLDENRRLSDLIAEAVDEWLVKRGHPPLWQLRE